MQYLEDVLNMLETYLEPFDCTAKSMYQIQVSAEEVFTNIASYAYDSDDGMIEVLYWEEIGDSDGKNSDQVIFWITMKDWGRSYNPLEHPDPDFEIPFEERGVGGLGIYMVKQFMDYVEYHSEDGCNILTIGKKL